MYTCFMYKWYSFVYVAPWSVTLYTNYYIIMDNIVSINYTTQDKKFVISINGYVLYLQHILVQTLTIPIALQILNFKIV